MIRLVAREPSSNQPERSHLAGLCDGGFLVLAAEPIWTPEARKMRALPVTLADLRLRHA